jgi:hypothetical protein
MYLRFVITRNDEDSRARQGILVAAHELRDEGDLEPYEHELLRTTLAWFNQHLRIPAVLAEPKSARGLSWFKPEAEAAIQRMWDLVGVLRTHGAVVELLKTDAPGTVIYEDKWQIVAKPAPRDRTRGRW